MRNVTGPRILAMALMAVAALALAGCGNGPKRRITTTVTTTTPARVAAPVVGAATVSPVAGAAGVAGASAARTDGAGTAGAGAGGDAAKRGGGAAVPAAQPVNPDLRKTSDKMLAATVGFGVLADGVAQTAAAGGAGLAGAGGQQCQNPFGTQPAGNGQLICSAGEERLMCQCDDNGCQLVPTGIMSCLPVGAVYQ